MFSALFSAVVDAFSVLRHFRPTFPWSIAHHEPERWELIHHVRRLAAQDVFHGEILDRETAERLRSLSNHDDWLIRFGAKTVLHFSGHDMSSDLKNVSESEWELARKNTAKNEAQIHHVVSIFGVPLEKVPLVAALRVLYATPPRLEVTRRIFRVS